MENLHNNSGKFKENSTKSKNHKSHFTQVDAFPSNVIEMKVLKITKTIK
jgi:hypothetical protein